MYMALVQITRNKIARTVIIKEEGSQEPKKWAKTQWKKLQISQYAPTSHIYPPSVTVILNNNYLTYNYIIIKQPCYTMYTHMHPHIPYKHIHTLANLPPTAGCSCSWQTERRETRCCFPSCPVSWRCGSSTRIDSQSRRGSRGVQYERERESYICGKSARCTRKGQMKIG